MIRGRDDQEKYRRYFAIGLSALEIINDVLQSANLQPRRILDLPCGHGRVLRCLRAAYPTAELYACDLLEDGVDFCRDQFGATGVYSKVDFDELVWPGNVKFDLIWSGSLITHLPEHRCRSFLNLCERSLETEGIAVVTIVGESKLERHRAKISKIRKEINDARSSTTNSREGVLGPKSEDPPALARLETVINGYEKEGFGYAPGPRGQEYWDTAIREDWIRAAANRAGLEVCAFKKRQWDNNQDVVVLKKMS